MQIMQNIDLCHVLIIVYQNLIKKHYQEIINTKPSIIDSIQNGTWTATQFIHQKFELAISPCGSLHYLNLFHIIC